MKYQIIHQPVVRLLLLAGVCAASSSQCQAVQSSTEVWVGSSTALQGSTQAGVTVSLFSQRMVLPIETAGKVSLLQGALLTDTNSTWTDSQFGPNVAPAYVEFDNGWTADITDCSVANHTLTLAGSLGVTIPPGSAYRVRKHFTVASMFGPNNEAGLSSGLNASTADNIYILVPQTQQTISVFYYHDSSGFHGWYNSSFFPADKQVIYPEQGLMVRRVVPSNTSLYLAGPAKIGPSVVTIEPGFNLVGTLKSSTSLSLSGLNLFSGDPVTGLVTGLNPRSSDNLMVVQPNGSTSVYFYYQDPNFSGWLDGSFNFADSVQISPGTAFFVWRKSTGAFNWTIPAE